LTGILQVLIFDLYIPQGGLIYQLSDFPRTFPAAHDYGDFIPGWDFFDDFFIRLRYILTICLGAVVMGYIISREENRSVNPLGSNILGILVAAPLILTLFAPANGMGGAGELIQCPEQDNLRVLIGPLSLGYSFWTNNREYNRLKVLFNIAFEPEYLRSLIKDGLADSFLEG